VLSQARRERMLRLREGGRDRVRHARRGAELAADLGTHLEMVHGGAAALAALRSPPRSPPPRSELAS